MNAKTNTTTVASSDSYISTLDISLYQEYDGASKQLYHNGKHQLAVILTIQKRKKNTSGIYEQVSLSASEKSSIKFIKASGNSLSTGWSFTTTKNKYLAGIYSTSSSEGESLPDKDSLPDISVTPDILTYYLSAGTTNDESMPIAVTITTDEGVTYRTDDLDSGLYQKKIINTQTPISCRVSEMSHSHESILKKNFYIERWALKEPLYQMDIIDESSTDYHFNELAFFESSVNSYNDAHTRQFCYLITQGSVNAKYIANSDSINNPHSYDYKKNDKNIVAGRYYDKNNDKDGTHTKNNVPGHDQNFSFIDQYGTTHKYCISGGSGASEEDYFKMTDR